ncbi:ABC transporter permease subunit [Haloarcula mannanilytica]|uniref:ABC transporter permease subunit n=1 Tax=Haloarcula mannanilytica TaxID=2509225 RepID=UPI0010F90530
MTITIGGLDVAETVFNWPDIGYGLVNSGLGQDFQREQFVFAVIAVVIMLISPPTYWTQKSTQMSQVLSR